MKHAILLVTIGLSFLTACSQKNSQDQKNGASDAVFGGRCETCEVIFESPVPFDKLSWIDTLPDYNEAGPKMEISGTMYHADGTPAKDVVIYIYHTDQKGLYSNPGNFKGASARHGYIRGWMKTNEKGQYKFYTLQPASYPNTRALKHIHPVIKEAGKNAYWIDEFVFSNDPFLTPAMKHDGEKRGGAGILDLTEKNGILVGKRDIILGKNVPGYPSPQ